MSARKRSMRVAYADPPYPGQARAIYRAEAEADGRRAAEVNHPLLIAHLCDEFPDGWALSTSSSALAYVLPLCPTDVRVMAWVKGWCSWKPGNYPAYAWEPVILRGGRKPKRGDRSVDTQRDWLQCNVTTNQPVKGAKPEQFCRWVFACLGARPDDELVDLFPGSGAVGRAWERWRCERPLTYEPVTADALDFDEAAS